MLGSVIGDIAGSIYEFNNIKTKEFELFTDEKDYTDDSIMSIAVAEAVLNTKNVRDEEAFKSNIILSMQKFGRQYPHPMGAYGGRFMSWLLSSNPQPYNSWGNGSAMRVAACAYAAESLEDVQRIAKWSAEVTHNHPEGIKGAVCTATCVWMALHGAEIGEIREKVNEEFYPLSRTVDEIRPGYVFDVSCQGTVPEAVEAFLESCSFEDAIRTAVSLGGDSDTLTAITGGIAEAFYGIPEEIRERALSYLPRDLLQVVLDFEKKYRQ